MGRPQDDLGVVGKLPRRLLFKLAELVDESIITTPLDIAEIKNVLGDTNTDVGKIMRVFYNIVTYKDDPKTFIKFIDSTRKLTDSDKSILKDVMKKIHSKVDAENIRSNRKVINLDTFGHMHAHIDESSITTEFRPFSDGNKIIRIVSSLVIDASIHDLHGNHKSINFQMDLDEAEQFADLLNKNIKSLKSEILEMREKFGSDII